MADTEVSTVEVILGDHRNMGIHNEGALPPSGIKTTNKGRIGEVQRCRDRLIGVYSCTTLNV